MEDKTEGVADLKPGETIRPSASSAQTPPPPSPQVPQETVQPTAQPQVAAPTVAPQPSPPVADQAPASAPASLPTPESSEVAQFDSQPTGQTDDPAAISWTASEFIDHDKSLDWYLGLAVVAILSAVVLYIFFKDIITSITPLVAALALGFYGRRSPRQLQYTLDSQGITIADKFFPYELFRSFAVMEDGAFASIAFLPLKRFGLLTTVYLDPQDEDRIIDLISQFLPFEPRDHDAVDRLMKRIRF